MTESSTLARPSPESLRAARRENPGMRARDLADKLGVSEAALLAADVDGRRVIRIEACPDKLMPLVTGLGEVLALTRNTSCVHERVGTYEDWHSGEHAAMILGPEIDLRIFPRHWVHGFAVLGERASLQIFDAAGDAVHKIHMREGSDRAALDALVDALRLPEQGDEFDPAPRAAPEGPRGNPDRAEDLRRDWAEMTDTHQFLRLVSRLKMNRLGAYRMAGAPLAVALRPEAVSLLLTEAARREVQLMLFVGNNGCIQIHGGTVSRVEPMGPWMNVLDPRFNLHLRADHIAEVWLVNKPTRRGDALSVEAFDSEGGLIVQIFGRRDPDTSAFDALVAGLPRSNG